VTASIDRVSGPAVPPADGLTRASGRPVGGWAFLGLALVSLGGPLALAALYAPQMVKDASGSAGLAMLAAAVVFAAPMAIWLKYSRHVAGEGGLYAFVEVAAGRRFARAQAGVWIASYLLYLLYTTASIVYDTLPAVLPGVRPYRPLLEIAIPVALAAVMLAGRGMTLVVIGLMAVGQIALVGVLDAVTLAHSSPAASSLAYHAPGGELAHATANSALLYICGSLPLFLGGELDRPAHTVRRVLPLGYLLVVVGVLLAVFPLSSNPAFTNAPIPGMSVVQVFAGHGLAVAVGVGVAVSVAGVMLTEYLALSRLLHAVTSWSRRRIVAGLGVALVAAAPVSLIDPDRFYSDLLKPSLAALWISQAMVFAVYPRFARRHGSGRVAAYLLAGVSVALAVYGLWDTLASSAGT
jgi:amino acid transporter